MIGSALLMALAVFVGVTLWLAGECRFLIPYRVLIFRQYGTTLLIVSAVLLFNLFCGFYAVCRRLFLNDTGRKLEHLEKQLRSGSTLSEELSKRLEER